MTSRLFTLESRLTQLRRVLAALRLGSAACTLVATVGLALLFVWLLDWCFRLAIPERLLVMLLATAGSVWGYWRLGRPRLRRARNELEAALFVQRQHDIDSDLVAALQFSRAHQDASSSPRLAEAVIDYVAAAVPDIDVFQGVTTKPFIDRLTGMLAVLGMFFALSVAFPGHLTAFGQRLRLSSQPYPSRTRIEQVIVADHVVFEVADGDETLKSARAAEGKPLRVKVICSGLTPASVLFSVRPSGGWSAGTRLALKPETPGGSSKPGPTVFVGQLPRLVENVTYTLTAGDAPQLIGEIDTIPLPIVELTIHGQPPAYAAQELPTGEPAGRHSLIEGSSVQIHVRSRNGKPLKAVFIVVDGAADAPRVDCLPQDPERLLWASPQGASMLSDLRHELRYDVQVTDDDGLSPQVPIRGAIRIRPDAPPTATVELVHRLVLPAAKPLIAYRVTDDHGVAGLELIVDIERATQPSALSESEEPPADRPAPENAPAAPSPNIETRRYHLPLANAPLTNDQLPLTGSYTLDLAPLDLAAGDRLKLAVEVSDYRGERESASSVSDARVVEVGDENAVLAAIREADERSEAQLNELIRSQLGIGKQP